MGVEHRPSPLSSQSLFRLEGRDVYFSALLTILATCGDVTCGCKYLPSATLLVGQHKS